MRELKLPEANLSSFKPGSIQFAVLNFMKEAIVSNGQAVLHYSSPRGAGWD